MDSCDEVIEIKKTQVAVIEFRKSVPLRYAVALQKKWDEKRKLLNGSEAPTTAIPKIEHNLAALPKEQKHNHIGEMLDSISDMKTEIKYWNARH